MQHNLSRRYSRHDTWAHARSAFVLLQAKKEEEEEEWVATAPAGQSGCVILVEGNPPPGAHMGHMSFNSFNPELEKLQVA